MEMRINISGCGAGYRFMKKRKMAGYIYIIPSVFNNIEQELAV
jgi:hypothetical protein